MVAQLNPVRRVTAWKRPAEKPKFGWDWSDVLETGDTIASQVTTGSGVVIDASTNTTNTTVFRVSGGTAQTRGTVTTTITTVAGDIYQGVHEFTIAD